MPNELVFGDKIIKFEGDATGKEQISRLRVMQLMADKSITIKKRTLNEFLGNNFNIPDYQRGYEWGEEEWTELWDEIEPLTEVETGATDPEVPDVFFGSVFFSEREVSSGTVLDVIDGQQRITTLTIFFKLIADRMQKAFEEDGSLFGSLGAEIGNVQNLVYKDASPGAADDPVLELDRHNNEFFESIIGGQEKLLIYLANQSRVHGNTEDNAISIRSYLRKADINQDDYFEKLDDNDTYEQRGDQTTRPNLTDRQKSDLPDDSSNDISDSLKSDILSNKVEMADTNHLLLNCYGFFRERLDETLVDLESPQERAYALANIKNFILHSFHVGYFEVDDDRPRLLMKIFEILNDRGVELKKTDVIRTRVVGRFRGETNEDKYLDTWEDIVGEFGNKHSRVIDFLQTYFVTTGHADSRGEIKNRILEAFSLSENEDESVLEAQMTDVDDAENFLDDLLKYSKYYHHIIDPNNYGVSFGEEGDDDIENECNQIITRLHKTNTSIWEPIVLGLYHDTREEVENQSKLLSVLRAAESMAIRNYAAMDINVRDQAYSSLMSEYSDNGTDGDLVETLTDIETDDPQAVGEDLVRALYRKKWRNPWSKQVLRKVSSEGFETGENQMVLRQLNLDDGLVHLEHVFPQEPTRSSASEPYEWYSKFFRTDADDGINRLISRLISAEDSELLEEISEEYIHDIGNQILLRSRENLEIGNSLFGKKLATYFDTQEFCGLRTNRYLCEEIADDETIASAQAYVSAKGHSEDVSNDNWEEIAEQYDEEFESREALESHLETVIEANDESFADIGEMWTYNEMTEMRADIVEALCESIKFSEDEFDFEGADESSEESEESEETEAEEEAKTFLSLSKEETARRNEVLATNHEYRV